MPSSYELPILNIFSGQKCPLCWIQTASHQAGPFLGSYDGSFDPTMHLPWPTSSLTISVSVSCHQQKIYTVILCAPILASHPAPWNYWCPNVHNFPFMSYVWNLGFCLNTNNHKMAYLKLFLTIYTEQLQGTDLRSFYEGRPWSGMIFLL